MIGAPPAQDEQARLSGARGDFVASLPRRLEVLRAALRAVEDQPRDAGRINGLLRRLHALGEEMQSRKEQLKADGVPATKEMEMVGAGK